MLNNIIEIWKPIVEFPDRYEVSNLGRVRSVEKKFYHKIKSQHETTTSNYLYVAISVNNKTKMRLMTLSMHGWAGGYVQYGIKNEKIPVVLTKLSSETLIKGRPPLVDSEWVEVVDGNINGKYHFTYQGAIFDKIEYISPKGAKFQFKQTDYDYDDCFSER